MDLTMPILYVVSESAALLLLCDCGWLLHPVVLGQVCKNQELRRMKASQPAYISVDTFSSCLFVLMNCM